MEGFSETLGRAISEPGEAGLPVRCRAAVGGASARAAQALLQVAPLHKVLQEVDAN